MSRWVPGTGVRILSAEQAHGRWVTSAVGDGPGACPDCKKQSLHRLGWHERHLQDEPAQGAGVTVKLRIQRWQCRNKACKWQSFAWQQPKWRPLWRAAPRGRPISFIFLAMAHGGARRTVAEAPRHAGQRRYNPAPPQTAGKGAARRDKRSSAGS